MSTLSDHKHIICMPTVFMAMLCCYARPYFPNHVWPPGVVVTPTLIQGKSRTGQLTSSARFIIKSVGLELTNENCIQKQSNIYPPRSCLSPLDRPEVKGQWVKYETEQHQINTDALNMSHPVSESVMSPSYLCVAAVTAG